MAFIGRNKEADDNDCLFPDIRHPTAEERSPDLAGF
jgi:hypothetical protein